MFAKGLLKDRSKHQSQIRSEEFSANLRAFDLRGISEKIARDQH